MMLPYVRVGPLLLQLPGLALLAGIWVGSNFVEREANRLRLNTPAILNMIMYGLVAGLLGARLLYALEHFNAYIAAPLSLLALSASALDAWGGLLVGAGTALVYARAKGLRRRSTLDALAPGVAVFMIAVGAANVLSGNGYGSPLDAPWAIDLWGESRHPTQIYEVLLAVGVLLVWRFMPAGSSAPGNSFWQVAGLSAAARIFTEALHGDSTFLPGGFRLVQVAGLLVLGASMYFGKRWTMTTAEQPGAPPKSPRRAALRQGKTGEIRTRGARTRKTPPRRGPTPRRTP